MTKENNAKTDCFAFRKGECRVLYELVCEKKKCSFYKTCEQFMKDKKKYSLKRSSSI